MQYCLLFLTNLQHKDSSLGKFEGSERKSSWLNTEHIEWKEQSRKQRLREYFILLNDSFRTNPLRDLIL